jgi:hypothetical protein
MMIIHPVFPTTTKKEETMKITIALVAALIFAAFAVQAADQGKKSASTVQTERMRFCNAEAKRIGLKGDDRKIFMNDCLGVSARQKQPNKASSSKNRNKW